MGNTLKKIQSDGFINWQHRPYIANNPDRTAAGQWISYLSEVSAEIEEAIGYETSESVFTIQNEESVYNGDQILFNGDIATRLGGPLIHRGSADKSIRELRRVANGFFYQDKGDFTKAMNPVPNECPDKAVLLNSISCHAIFRELYKLANRDFQVEQSSSNIDSFVQITDTKGLVPSKHPNASNNFFSMQVIDEKNVKHQVIVQQYDFDLVTVEQAILHTLQGTDSKVAALLIEEARVSMIIEQMTKVLCMSSGACFQRVEVEIDSTATRRAKK
jgi:hypothetical protein